MKKNTIKEFSFSSVEDAVKFFKKNLNTYEVGNVSCNEVEECVMERFSCAAFPIGDIFLLVRLKNITIEGKMKFKIFGLVENILNDESSVDIDSGYFVEIAVEPIIPPKIIALKVVSEIVGVFPLNEIFENGKELDNKLIFRAGATVIKGFLCRYSWHEGDCFIQGRFTNLEMEQIDMMEYYYK